MNYFSRNLTHPRQRPVAMTLLRAVLPAALFAAIMCMAGFPTGLAGTFGALAIPVLASAPLQQNLPQSVLVQFDKSVSAEMRATLIAEMGGELVSWLAQIHVAEIYLPSQSQVLGISGSDLSPLATSAMPTVASAVNSGLITFAEANAVVRAAYIPSDPDFLNETMSHGLKEIQALDAWDIVTGSPEIVIAVVDSGVFFDHPEFAGRLVAGYDYINGDGVADDDSGHGTRIAGVIAAALDNGQGIAGVCPQCRLMPVKVLNAENMGTWVQLAQGIIFAVDNGARIINLSLGAAIASETLASAVDYAVERGVVVVAAAGNYNTDQSFYPAALAGVIGVSATNIKGEAWNKSNFGSHVDLTAPGDIIYSTSHDLDGIYHGYTYASGTSMSAAYVSGVAGLLLSFAPELSAAEVYSALTLGADDLGAAGWDPAFGHGRVNALGALNAPVDGLVEAMGDLDEPQQALVIYLPSVNK